MSMYTQAEKLKSRFTSMFNEMNIKQADREAVIDLIIRFGQVAKFRCRSNTAYENFLEAVFSDLAVIRKEQRKTKDGRFYTVLYAHKPDCYEDEEEQTQKEVKNNE